MTISTCRWSLLHSFTTFSTFRTLNISTDPNLSWPNNTLDSKSSFIYPSTTDLLSAPRLEFSLSETFYKGNQTQSFPLVFFFFFFLKSYQYNSFSLVLDTVWLWWDESFRQRKHQLSMSVHCPLEATDDLENMAGSWQWLKIVGEWGRDELREDAP